MSKTTPHHKRHQLQNRGRRLLRELATIVSYETRCTITEERKRLASRRLIITNRLRELGVSFEPLTA